MRLVLLAIQMLFLLAPAFAEDPFLQYVGRPALDKLRAGHALTAGIPSDGALTLAPAIAGRDAMVSDMKTKKPTLGVEMLRMLSGLPQAMDTPQGRLVLYNTLHAVSTMKGIPYFSVTRNSSHTLFTESYAVDPVSRKDRIADPVFTEVPASDLLFTFQEDQTFGKNYYEESFSEQFDHLVVKMENLSTISFLFFQIIQPRDLVSEVILIPNGTDLVFYGVSSLNTGFPLGDKHSREESLANRLNAMASWLEKRLGSAPAPGSSTPAAADPSARPVEGQ